MGQIIEIYPYPIIERFLIEHAQGTSEYELIQYLKKRQISLNGHSHWDLSQPQSLFDSHFEVMHALYQLRDLWRQSKKAELMITPLQIWMAPYQALTPTSGIAPQDKLREFYLDRSNQTEVTAESIEALIQQFMSQAAAASEIDHALEVLGFPASSSPNWTSIKKRYRALLSEVHPDKGGDHQKASKANQAYHILRNFYLKED